MQNLKPKQVLQYLFDESDKRMIQAGLNVYSQNELRGYYDFRIDDDCTGIVMIDQYVHCGALNFSINVGTRIDEVERVVNAFLPLLTKESQLRRDHERTIAIHSGYTSSTPTHQTYSPKTRKHVDSDLDAALEIAFQFGIPYLQRIKNVRSIYSHIGALIHNISWSSLPVIYLLMNEKEKAISSIQRSILFAPAFDADQRQKLEYGTNLIKYINTQFP